MTAIQEYDRLDMEFRKILRVIKPYIPCIMNNGYLFSYRMWLEKLSEAAPSEKEERNKYLVELCRQIQDGILEKPFVRLPTPGPLQPLDNKMCNPTIENNFLNELDNNSQNFVSLSDNFVDILKPSEVQSNENSSGNEDQFAYGITEILFSNRPENKSEEKNDVNSFTNLEKIMQENKSKRISEVKKLETIAEIQGNILEDDSSWYDLTDLSSVTTDNSDFKLADQNLPNGSQDETSRIYQAKMASLLKIISKLKEQNMYLQEKLQKYKIGNEETEANVSSLIAEVNSLKSRLKELTDIKLALKSSQMSASSQWQDTVNALNTKLQSAQNQNAALKSDVEALEKRVQVYAEKEQSENSFRDKLEKSHAGQIEELEQSCNKKIGNLESKYQNIIKEKEDDFKLHLNKLQQMHDDKLNEVDKLYTAIIGNKDEEIQRLEGLVDKQRKTVNQNQNGIKRQNSESTSTNDGDSSEKVTFLLKLLAKMEKLFKKTEKEYCKHINKLKRELAIRDKFLQLQLKAQKAELVTCSSSTRQVEMNDLVMQLEVRYKKILNNQQKFFENEKMQDMKVISGLRSVLTKKYEEECN